MEVHLIIQSDDQSAYLVLDVDAAPGILPAPVHLASARVGDGHVGAHNCEGHPLPHPVMLRLHLGDGEVVDLDLVLLKLQQDLKHGSTKLAGVTQRLYP